MLKGVLHLVSRSPGESFVLAQCLERAGKDDAVLLLESGVYAAVKGSAFAPKMTEYTRRIAIYALSPDLAARGISAEEILDGVIPVDYEGFVGLSVMHTPILTWN